MKTKGTDIIALIELSHIDKWGINTVVRADLCEIRLSITINSMKDSHHIQFPHNIERAHMSYLLRQLAESIDKGPE